MLGAGNVTAENYSSTLPCFRESSGFAVLPNAKDETDLAGSVLDYVNIRLCSLVWYNLLHNSLLRE